MGAKLTKEERNWVLYDVGNSAFTLLITTIVPIYFNYLAGNAGLSDVDYLAYWGYAASLATLLVAFMGPVCGSLADTKGYKKPIFVISLIVGAVGCISLGFAKNWLVFLVIYLIAKVGYSGSLIFYDSMLPDVTESERMDEVSSKGYAFGYIGSCIPFVVSLVIVLGAGAIGITMELAMGIAFFYHCRMVGTDDISAFENLQAEALCREKEGCGKRKLCKIGKNLLQREKGKEGIFIPACLLLLY